LQCNPNCTPFLNDWMFGFVNVVDRDRDRDRDRDHGHD
jgi:hypothetical protein